MEKWHRAFFSPAALANSLPFVRWFPLRREALAADAMAGLTVAMVLIPQAMAYAGLANLPVQYGLYSACAPVVVAALFGWCHQLSTGPVAMTALLVGAEIAKRVTSPASVEECVRLALALAFLSGLIRLMMGLLRMAALANLLSHAVIIGFMNAGALIIAATQIPDFFGLQPQPHDIFPMIIAGIVRDLCHAHLPTMAMASGALALLVLLPRWRPRWPAAFLTMALGTLTSWALGFEAHYGGKVVGFIPPGLPKPALPGLRLEEISGLLPGSILIAFIGFMEVLSVSKAAAIATRQRLNFNQELIGQGLANIIGSCLGSYPVSGSFSRTALNLYAGARTGLCSIFAAAAVVVALLCLTPFLYHLPRAVLAATIIAAVARLLNLRTMIRIWRVDWRDGLVAFFTFFAVLACAPHLDAGILAGVGLALALYLYGMMQPRMVVVAEHPDGRFRDAALHNLTPDPEILALRFDGRLVFLNAAHFEESVSDALAERPAVRAVLLMADGINDIDAAGVESLRHIVQELRRTKLRVAVSGLKAPVQAALARAGVLLEIGIENIFSGPHEAMADLRADVQSARLR